MLYVITALRLGYWCSQQYWIFSETFCFFEVWIPDERGQSHHLRRDRRQLLTTAPEPSSCFHLDERRSVGGCWPGTVGRRPHLALNANYITSESFPYILLQLAHTILCLNVGPELSLSYLVGFCFLIITTCAEPIDVVVYRIDHAANILIQADDVVSMSNQW